MTPALRHIASIPFIVLGSASSAGIFGIWCDEAGIEIRIDKDGLSQPDHFHCAWPSEQINTDAIETMLGCLETTSGDLKEADRQGDVIVFVAKTTDEDTLLVNENRRNQTVLTRCGAFSEDTDNG